MRRHRRLAFTANKAGQLQGQLLTMERGPLVDFMTNANRSHRFLFQHFQLIPHVEALCSARSAQQR
jgi:hypothetical protein